MDGCDEGFDSGFLFRHGVSGFLRDAVQSLYGSLSPGGFGGHVVKRFAEGNDGGKGSCIQLWGKGCSEVFHVRYQPCLCRGKQFGLCRLPCLGFGDLFTHREGKAPFERHLLGDGGARFHVSPARCGKGYHRGLIRAVRNDQCADHTADLFVVFHQRGHPV